MVLKHPLVIGDLRVVLLLIEIVYLIRHVEVLVADAQVCEKIVFADDPEKNINT